MDNEPRYIVEPRQVTQYAVIDTRTGAVSTTEYGNKRIAPARVTAEEWARVLNMPFASFTGA
jgi:hypothetical protein